LQRNWYIAIGTDITELNIEGLLGDAHFAGFTETGTVGAGCLIKVVSGLAT
jgi:hypothetical protein